MEENLNLDANVPQIKPPRDFTVFRNALARYASIDTAYQRDPRVNSSVRKEFSIEEIKDAIANGNPSELRTLSKHYYRYSGVYSRMVEYLATLLLYETILVPKYDISHLPKKQQVLKTYNSACAFIDTLSPRDLFPYITRKILIEGLYFGVLRRDNSTLTMQDLPVEYCRTRFKNSSGLDILEFDTRYFNKIIDKEMRLLALATYPKIIVKAYLRYIQGYSKDPWIEVSPEDGGAVFYYADIVPFLVSSLPKVLEYDSAQEREAQRDTNELYKLLIQKMPLTNENELVFDLDETAQIHESIANMLKNNNSIDVLTTFGEVSLENIQDPGAAAATNNRLEKYKQAMFDELGTTSELFNGTGNISQQNGIIKDTALMTAWSNMYAKWVRFQINLIYSKPGLEFDFEILPITLYNKKDMTAMYVNGAQYGFSKLYAGAALGIKQSNFMSLMSFENDMLTMTEKMIPLQSSYTSSDKILEKTGESTSKTKAAGDTNNEGRPQLDDNKQTDKTIQNKNSE